MRRLALLLAGFGAALALVGCAGGDEAATTTIETTTDRPRPAVIPPSELQGHWVITDLGSLPGLEECWAVAINDRGQVIGNCQNEIGGVRGFFWRNGKMTDLGTLPGRKYSSAVAMNERGQVVGYSFSGYEEKSEDERDQRAFLWQNGKMTDLGKLPGGAESYAADINEPGQVVGKSETTNWDWHAFLWREGKMTDLGTLPDSKYSSAVAINERGDVAGDSSVENLSHAFLWIRGRMTNLGAIPGQDGSTALAINDGGHVLGQSGDLYHGLLWKQHEIVDLGWLSQDEKSSTAAAINERDQIVGWSDMLPSHGWGLISHAFLWENGTMTDLGTLGGDESQAFAVNERGQIVGEADTKPGPHRSGGPNSHAFFWENGMMIDLGTLPDKKYSDAVAVNERGQIVGSSALYSGKTRAVLWTLKP